MVPWIWEINMDFSELKDLFEQWIYFWRPLEDEYYQLLSFHLYERRK
jgi:hypothetical protein